MRWWRFSTILTLAAALGALGCGGSSSSGVAITVTPTIASVITNRTQLFSGAVTGSSNTAITWTLACASGVTVNTCGTIDATGLYTAPATIPTITSSGTVTIEPAVTITATAQADTSKAATATLTIVTGISIAITPTTATVGTTEFFLFTATVNNPGCNITSDPTCENVTWSLPTPPSGAAATVFGSIGATTGVYTAPATVPTTTDGSIVIVTATSVADTSATATATVTVVTASNPTVTSVSPNATALGGLFQDIFITGTNFISTENVYINGSKLASTFVSDISSSVIRARIPDYILAVPPPPPSNALQVTVSEQSGTAQMCTTTDGTVDETPCEITVTGARPGVVGPSPDSIPQGTAGVLSFNVDGGFFGTGANPASPDVSATYNGQLRGIQLPASQTIGSTRQLSVTIGGGSNSSDFTVPGLYPVAISSTADSSKFAVTNLAIQPTYAPPSAIRLAVGTAPSDVAVNPATGIAIVANNGSNDVTLVDINPLDPGTPRVINPSICTAAVGLVSPCLSFPSGPTSVSVDYNQNIALVVNSTSKSVAVVDLNAQKVLSVTPIPFPAGGVADTPEAVGINPVTGQALVAMQTKNYGVLMDLTKSPPAFVGVVSISTGPNTRVAVEPNLNWALATPGGLGSLAIVDLSQKSTNTITAISRTTNVVTVTVDNSASAEPLSVQAGDAVQNLNVQFSAAAILANPALATLAPTFDGYFAVTQTGPAANQFSYTETGQTFPDVASASAQVSATGPIYYSQPVATVGLPLSDQGIGINPETQQAVLVDPTTGGVVSFFSLIDQSVSSLTLETNGAAESGTTAAAYNPLTNTVVAVNSFTNTVSVIDPTAPRRLNDGNLYQLNTQCPLKNCAVAVAIDPGTNIAVVANQSDNSVSVLNLGAIKPFSLTETSPKTVITTSTLLSGPSPSPQTLTVIGKGLTCVGGRTSLLVRLDGVALDNISCVGNGDRELTATVPSNLLMSARRFALDVADLSGNVTNAEDFTVEQSVDVSSASCHAPQPTGVAIDPQLGPQGLAAVTLFGCNSLALINMATGTGSTVVVGTNPIGVAVLPRLHIAVVANNGGSGTASIVNEVQQSVTQTVATGTSPVGAAADQSTGEVAIANSVANTVTVVNAVTGGTNSISTGQGPIAVGFNYVNHQLAVAASSGNSVGVSDGAASTQTQSFTVNGPTSVIYDPVPTDCGDNINGTTTNTVGCFIASSSTGNSVSVIDPISSAQVTFRIGINPTAIAYNYLTSTLVSTNTASHTVTIADFLAQKIRAVLPLPPTTNATNANLGLSLASLQYGLDIHPFTNIAVVADTVNGRVLFLPLPR